MSHVSAFPHDIYGDVLNDKLCSRLQYVQINVDYDVFDPRSISWVVSNPYFLLLVQSRLVSH